MPQSRPLQQLTGRLDARPQLLAVILFSVLTTAKDLGGVFALAHATDTIMEGGNTFAALAIMLVVMLVGVGISAGDRYIRGRFVLHSRRWLMESFTAKFMKLRVSQSNIDALRGKINLYTEDVPSIISWYDQTLPALIQLVIYTLGATIYSLFQSVSLTLLVVPVISIIMPILFALTKRLTPSVAEERSASDRSLSHIQEALADHEFIKAYGLEDKMEARVAEALETRREAENRGHTVRAQSGGFSLVVSYLPGLLAAAVGGYYLMRGWITVGFLIAFIQMMMGRFSYIIPRISQFLNATKTTEVHAERLLDYLNLPDEVEASGVTDGSSSAPLMEVRDLSFAYEGKSNTLDRVSLQLHPGEQIALVGPSGSGKSTLLKLMLGYHPGAYEGSITLQGQELSEWQGQAFRAYIAPVFQDNRLFSGTILDNLKMVNSRTTEANTDTELAQAVDSYLETLEIPVAMLQQDVREQGSALSGGERQRVAVARALIKDSELYVFDEPTSALDSVTEAKLNELLQTAMVGKTVVTVSHKLSAVAHMDRIYYLRDGKIIESGTHEELMALDGAYAATYRIQEQEEVPA